MKAFFAEADVNGVTVTLERVDWGAVARVGVVFACVAVVIFYLLVRRARQKR